MANILLVDDHPSARKALADWLAEHGYHTIFHADSYQAGLNVAQTHSLTIAIIDIKIPLKTERVIHWRDEERYLGFNLARELRQLSPNLAIVLISSNCQLGREFKNLALEIGSHHLAYLVKATTEVEELITCLTKILAGEVYISQEVTWSQFSPQAESFLEKMGEKEREWVIKVYDTFPDLTTRQREVVHFYTHPRKVLASNLGISIKRLETLITEINQRLFPEEPLPFSKDQIVLKALMLRQLTQSPADI
ncbi:MAG: response regulator [Anaerolineae bacterium]|jgi:DNA-binding NarL/FixJ family response regulator|nr:response regulator [Anaerolineae bacterium]